LGVHWHILKPVATGSHWFWQRHMCLSTWIYLGEKILKRIVIDE
jgi:hypothetical protein